MYKLSSSGNANTGVFLEYSVKYFGEKEKIDINATATDPYYIVEITGNEKLVEGENTINILPLPQNRGIILK